MIYLTLVPAYGRDYSNIKSVLADFDNDKDFIVSTFGYPEKPVNKSNLIEMGYACVSIRFDRLRKKCTATL